MKKIRAGLAAAVVAIFAVCAMAPAMKKANCGNTVLTGQVMHMNDDTVTMQLGELAYFQTPETSTGSLSVYDITPAKGANSLQGASEAAAETFVSWERDTTLNLEDAKIYSLDCSGQIQAANLGDVAPRDVISVAVGDDNLAASVTILTDGEHGYAELKNLQGSAADIINEDYRGRDTRYISVANDENALKVDTGEADLRNVRVEKPGGSASNLYGSIRYGLNAALLAVGGTQLTLSDTTVNSSADGSSGIFSHGAGTMVYLDGGAVTTTGDSSGGVEAAGGAGLYAKSATVITSGDSAAVIRVGFGSTGVQVEGGTYASGGDKSPVICASGELKARNADFTANNSQAVALEGAGSVLLEDCAVTGKASSAEAATVSISGSADLPEGAQGRFSMLNGSLTSRSGDVFHVTDADCSIELENVAIDCDGQGNFLRVAGEESAAAVVLAAKKQDISGNVLVDGRSDLQLGLTDKSYYTGSVQRTEDPSENGGTITVYLDRESTWSLTGDSVVDVLHNEGTIQYNGYTITLADGTVLTQ